MSATHLRYPQWQQPLLRAVMETKLDSLVEKIQIAEGAISQRLRELEGNSVLEQERVALQDAVSTLRVLRSVLI
jgi:hypothetical protein